MDAVPSELEKIDNGRYLRILWSDGAQQRLKAFSMRKACPCATCREKKKADQAPKPAGRQSLTVLSSAELAPITIQSMAPAGNYAYLIHFSDGHQTGLYSFDLLRSFASSPETGS